MVEPSEALQLVFDKAVKDAKKLQHEYVTLEHLLYAMLCEENFTNTLTCYFYFHSFLLLVEFTSDCIFQAIF